MKVVDFVVQRAYKEGKQTNTNTWIQNYSPQSRFNAKEATVGRWAAYVSWLLLKYIMDRNILRVAAYRNILSHFVLTQSTHKLWRVNDCKSPGSQGTTRTEGLLNLFPLVQPTLLCLTVWVWNSAVAPSLSFVHSVCPLSLHPTRPTASRATCIKVWPRMWKNKFVQPWNGTKNKFHE